PSLARQPILTKEEKVIGYEVMFREFSDGSESSDNNLFEAVGELSLEVLSDGHPAFIPCTNKMLEGDGLLTLPLDKVVVQIGPDVEITDELVEACDRLRQNGYKIALDKFLKGDPREPLLPYADCIKVDWKSRDRAQSFADLKPYQLLAQNVDSRA